MTVEFLQHNRVALALHRLREAPGRPLLLLHGLGEQSPAECPEFAQSWPGPVCALDFTGHGASTVPIGGGYTAEVLLADADTALAHLGSATVVGRGLGAYIALMLAGSRPAEVHGTVLCDGSGLIGGSSVPTTLSFFDLGANASTPDPWVLMDLSRDLRPPDYAVLFAHLALDLSPVPDPISVAAVVRPLWVHAVVNEIGIVERPLEEALAAYAEA
jgi:pimeloyl-ACP methyl ester carboxylesterase